MQDIRFAIRQFLKRPGFTLTAILILALGLGANTAIFSVVNAFLLRPLPYQNPGRLAALFEDSPLGPVGNEPFNEVAPGNFLDWQKLSTSFEEMAASVGGASNLSSPSDAFEPQRVDNCACSSTLFSTLGVHPLLGRGFRNNEDRYGAPHVVVISYGLWQQRFGAMPDIIGKQIRLDGENYQVIGVMPRGFGFPYRTTQLWIPLLASITPEQQKSHSNHFLLVVGRLRTGVSMAQAKAEINTLAARYKREHPEAISGKGGNVVSLQSYLVQGVRTSLLILLGAVGCVLVIACVNVANLLLARAAGRTREVAIREAIGASRGRIIRQLLTESVLLALAGAGGGAFLAGFVTQALTAHAPGADAVLASRSASAGPAVFVFAFAIALLAGVAAGLFPALQSSRSDLANSLRDSSRSATPSRAHGRFRNLLVAAEVALSLVLLVSAGLLLRSFSRLYGVKTGVRVEHSLLVGISLPDPAGNQRAKTSAFLRLLAERLQTVPGVVSAGMVSCPPVAGHCSDNVFSIEGRPLPPGQLLDALKRGADPGYFSAAGIPLLRGRTFTEIDGVGFDEKHPKAGAVVISESMAKKYFAGEDPLGKRIYFQIEEERKKQLGEPVSRYQIIGVVGDVIKDLDAPVEPTFYLPLLDGQFDNVYIMLHTAVEPHSVTAAVREAIHRLNPDLPLFQVRSMEEVIGRSASDREFSMLLFGSFAALAVVLAAVGLYGVLSYTVSQRKSEIGIRLALGAHASDVRGMILRQGLKPAIAGLLAGLLAAFFATRILQSLLFGISATDPLTFTLVPLFLLGVSIAACYLPAVRATRIDPNEALRTE
ncbi:MAG TPA: ABC transporter permease [Bryobacteraceae bacterium]